MRQKILAIGLSVILLTLFGAVPAHAEGAPHIEFRYISVASISVSLSYSGGDLIGTAQIQAKSNTTEIDGRMVLMQVQSDGQEVFVDSWDESASGHSLSWSGRTSADRGYRYHLHITADVTNSDGETETVTKTITKSI